MRMIRFDISKFGICHIFDAFIGKFLEKCASSGHNISFSDSGDKNT